MSIEHTSNAVPEIYTLQCTVVLFDRVQDSSTGMTSATILHSYSNSTAVLFRIVPVVVGDFDPGPGLVLESGRNS